MESILYIGQDIPLAKPTCYCGTKAYVDFVPRLEDAEISLLDEILYDRIIIGELTEEDEEILDSWIRFYPPPIPVFTSNVLHAASRLALGCSDIFCIDPLLAVAIRKLHYKQSLAPLPNAVATHH